MPNRQRQTRRRRRAGKVQKYMELISFSLSVGSSVSLTKGQLSGLPSNHNWKPHMIAVEVAPGYIPATSTHVASYCPIAINVQITEAAASVSTSKTLVISNQPRTVRVFYPPSQDWLSYSLNNGVQFGIIEAVCIGNPGQTAYARGIARVIVHLQPEVLPPSCPTMLLTEKGYEDPSTSSEIVNT